MIEIPQNFPGQQEGDKVVLFVHKHWIKYVVTGIFSILLASIPLIGIILYVSNNPSTDLISIEVITVSIGIYLLIVMCLIIAAFVDFYLDLLVITEDRVVFVRQNGYFNQQIDEAHIAAIDEVGADVKGLINSVLNCGDVVIHMGNDQAVLTVEDVQDPEKISKEILRLHKEYLDKNGYKKDEKDEIQNKETAKE